MFTGIVKAIALISALKRKDSLLTYSVDFPKSLLKNLITGASVAVDGVCQTVVDIQDNHVWFDAIEETLIRTTLGMMQIGTAVNLERSAKIGEEIGGHLLSGHIYGIAHVIKIENNVYTFACQKEWMKYFFSKGFIAIDGVSLTLVEIDRENGHFTVHLIPETLKRTILGQKKVGDPVNLEFDALTQAVVETTERHAMCEFFLRKNPYIEKNL